MRAHPIWTCVILIFAAAAGAAPPASGQGLPVTYERLLKADQEPGNWLMYSNTYNSWRFSRLDQINTQNVNRLHVKWLFQGRHQEKFETTPLVVDGIMYLTRPENAIYALDAETGRVLWSYEYRNPPRTYNCCGKVNRGLAILGNRLFMNTLDMHIIAIDAKSGRELWKTEMYDYTAAGGYAAPGAPLALKDKVIVGMAGGEHGVSGFLDAYDAATGKRLWRFNTIPQPGEPNFGTWAGDSWKTGGASTWNNGSYDPETNTLYWGTSNPWPDYNGDFRAGDNLYSCSVLALDPDTGKLKWYFQFTPHDLYDYDATETTVLIDAEENGATRHLLAQADRNGFFYVLDRTNVKFLHATPFVEKLNWAKSIDSSGRPILTGRIPDAKGAYICPGITGATNWYSPSYNPATKLFYVMALESCDNYFAIPRRFTPGETYYNTGTKRPANEHWQKKLLALSLADGKEVWRYPQVGNGNSWGGTMTTAGGLVFFGDDAESFEAVDAVTGKPLWHFNTGQRFVASPMTYAIGGRQYVAIAA